MSQKVTKGQKFPKTPLKIKLEKPTGKQKFKVTTVFRELFLTITGYTDDGLLLASSGLSHDIVCGF